MTSKEFKAFCERLGYGIAHVRRKAHTTQLRAYVVVYHKDDKGLPEHRRVAELRYDPTRGSYVYALAYRPEGRVYDARRGSTRALPRETLVRTYGVVTGEVVHTA